MKRETIVTLIESIATGCVVYGISSIYLPAGWIAAGLSILGISWYTSR
jgi:hypothetical protein